jgi:hypothetical protein
MTHISYPYQRIHSWRYIFVSEGKSQIQKVVEFVPVATKNIVNLGFGDLLPDGSVDDKVVSNNGDILKVLTTVANILRDYTNLYPKYHVLFTGSTDERTKLYNRILKMYHPIFCKEFSIVGALLVEGRTRFVTYNPDFTEEYFAFVIKKIY